MSGGQVGQSRTLIIKVQEWMQKHKIISGLGAIIFGESIFHLSYYVIKLAITNPLGKKEEKVQLI